LQVFNLDLLAAISASENSIIIVPSSISNLKSLLYLNLSYNQLTSLPESISDLKNLKELNISGNEINTKSITQLKKEMPNTIIKK
jgi:Leucine-rich repeat (LRR) protein